MFEWRARGCCQACERSAAFPDDEGVQCLGSSCDLENLMGGVCICSLTGGSRCQFSLVFWRSLLGQRSFQASAAFLLEPFVLAAAPSAFLELLGGRLTMVEVVAVDVVSELTS